jgi:hypothetical protein
VNVGPFDVAAIATRLRAEVGAFLMVGQRGDLAQLGTDAPLPAPAAFVLVASESAVGGRIGGASGGRLVQRVTCTVAVLIAAEQFRPNEEQPFTALPALIAASRAALLGFQPSGAESPLELESGRVLEDQPDRVLWLDTYRLSYFLDTAA